MDSLFASAYANGFAQVSADQIATAFGGPVTWSSHGGSDGSPLRTIAAAIKAGVAPWPDLFVIEDAALHHSSCYRDTPGTATCVVTVDGGGHVGAISGISDADGTYINGEGVYLEQGAHIGAEGTVTVVGGEITAVTLDSHGGATGSGYAAGACTIRKNAWLNQAIDIVDWILTNCATNGVSPRIVLCSGWWETAGDANPAQTMLVDGVSDTFAGHVARTFRGPEYSGLVRVVNTEPLGRVVGNVRITDEATVDGAYWTPNNPPSWASLPASTLYIVWYLDEDYVDVVDSSLVVG